MKTLTIMLALMLCGCEGDGPQAPTAGQSDELNEAENLLNGADSNDTLANDDIAPQPR